jgi:hypothetical protein
MKRSIFLPSMLCAATASHAASEVATSFDYQGRCVFSQLGSAPAARMVIYNGPCVITYGLIGIGRPVYRGALVQYPIKTGANHERTIRAWAEGEALMDGVPARETSTKAQLTFVSVEADDVRFTFPPIALRVPD